MHSFQHFRSEPRKRIQHYKTLISRIFLKVCICKFEENVIFCPYFLIRWCGHFRFHRNSQKTKFRCFLKYFDWLETAVSKKEKNNENDGIDGMEQTNEETNNTIKISRKVMSAKQWLTIEDWMECGLPLCPLEIKHEGRIERSQENIVQTIFASTRLGGSVLSSGNSQVNCLSE